MAPKGGVVMKEVRTPSKQRHEHYSASKAGNWFLAYEWDRRFGVDWRCHLGVEPWKFERKFEDEYMAFDALVSLLALLFLTEEAY
jgi:hypothetical protein